MSTAPVIITDLDLLSINAAAGSVQTKIDSLNDHVQSLLQQISLLHGEVDTDARTVQALKDSLAQAQAQLAAAASITVFDGLETTPWLVAPGTSANSGQTGNPTISTQAQPGVNSAWLGTAPAGPFANSYFFKKLGADPKKNKYTFDLELMLADPVAAAASQCIELDIQQVIAGVVYNTGLQFDFAENQLRVWDRSLATPQHTGAGDWKATGLASPRWTPGKWVSVKYETHRDAANVYVDAITLNGLRTPGTWSFKSPNLGLPDSLNCAVQLDGNKQGTAYRLYLDRVRFTAGVA